jgi:exopolyphosphatase/guanosine-5'-triphosphate,3'-diphosphate pyrophosphatase
VRAIAVHKRRVRYTIDGCTSEVTEVVADGRPVRTVAIESDDAGRVLGAVRAMGLAGFENISYPRGLKSLVGMHHVEA